MSSGFPAATARRMMQISAQISRLNSW